MGIFSSEELFGPGVLPVDDKAPTVVFQLLVGPLQLTIALGWKRAEVEEEDRLKLMLVRRQKAFQKRAGAFYLR